MESVAHKVTVEGGLPQINLTVNVNTDKDDDKDDKSSGIGKGMYYAVEFVAQGLMFELYPEVYAAGVVLGATAGLYDAFYRPDSVVNKTAKAAKSFDKASLGGKVISIATSAGLIKLASKIAAGPLYIGYQAMSSTRDMVANALVSKPAVEKKGA